MPNSLIPVGDEQAKAIQEALVTLRAVGEFLKNTLGTVPEDLVGVLGGDWLKVRRAENFARIAKKAQERLQARGVVVDKPASLSLVLPIAVSAADESRDELQDLWARLLAAAADPARVNFFRLAFIEAVKKMDPLDAAVLNGARSKAGRLDGNARNIVAAELKVPRDGIDISISNLVKLELMSGSPPHDPSIAFVSPLGREFLRAVSD